MTQTKEQSLKSNLGIDVGDCKDIDDLVDDLREKGYEASYKNIVITDIGWTAVLRVLSNTKYAKIIISGDDTCDVIQSIDVMKRGYLTIDVLTEFNPEVTERKLGRKLHLDEIQFLEHKIADHFAGIVTFSDVAIMYLREYDYLDDYAEDE